MNELNYASLEASKKLVDNWIVLETEAVWRKKRDKTGYYLSRKALYHRTSDVPAPSFVELWRELPDYIDEFILGRITPVLYKSGKETVAGYGSMVLGRQASENPADALAELWIWVKGQEGAK